MPASERAKRILTDEVREAAGEDAAGHARERLESGETGTQRSRTVRGMLERNKLPLTLSLAVALTVGVIAAVALAAWWMMAAALLVHAVVTTVVVGVSIAMTTQVEKPDPAAEARLKEEGVPDPEGRLNDLVEEAAGEEAGSRRTRAIADHAGETEPPADDSPEPTAKQQSAVTPTSEPTDPAGGKPG